MTLLAATDNDPSVFLAFTAGFVSFISPCVLPLVPGYLSTISGVSFAELQERAPGTRSKVLWPAVLFCLAFTIIFVALGMAATGLGQTLAENRTTLNDIAGIMIIVMGVFFLMTPLFPRLFGREIRVEALMARAGTGGPLVAGAAFAIAWTPCYGPTLTAILSAAALEDSVAKGGYLLAIYAAGLAVPFILSAIAFERATGAFRWLRDRYLIITAVAGAVLVAMGVLLLTDELTQINSELQRVLPDWLDFVYDV